ncbi:hypothetical protein N340_06290, partial [Tauraco erythrolophus]
GGYLPSRIGRVGVGVWEPTFQFPPPHKDTCRSQDLIHGVQFSCHFGIYP